LHFSIDNCVGHGVVSLNWRRWLFVSHFF
jgi:hypothetical protein